jgi:hypothetical protein
MAKVYVVGNPRGKNKKRAPSVRRRKNKKARKHANPLEAVIIGAGANPHRGGKMAAKRRHNKKRKHNPLFGKHKGTRHNRRRSRRFHNPILPVEARRVPALLVGGVAGGVGSVWLPSLIFPSATGLFSYALQAVVAVLGAWALGAFGFANAALGWLIGGGVAVVGGVIDDYTGKQIIQFSAPMSGMGQFYRQTGAFLPSASQTDLTNYVNATPSLLPTTGTPGAGAAVLTAGSPAAAKKGGMGWAMRRRAG